jgi:hypothetical protein
MQFKNQNIFTAFVRLTFTCLFFLSLSIPTLLAQETANIRGVVMDDSTGFPIPNVNVFLSNTTLGSATDENGRFRIENVPLGSYRVAASMMGYSFETEHVEVLDTITYEIEFELTQEALQGPSVEVVERYPRERRAQLRRFRDLFLGTTGNARKCELVNQYVLQFDVSESGHRFQAETVAPLSVVNNALGYKLTVFLEDFDWSAENEGRYVAAVQFEELEPEDKRQARIWRERRIEAYMGSRRHFLRSLIRGNFWREGFDVFRVYEINSNLHAQTARRMARASQNLISDTSADFLKELSFSGYLKIVYRPYNRVSYMHMNIPTILIDSRGNIFQPQGLTVFGHWSKMRVAEELPSNYEVPAG